MSTGTCDHAPGSDASSTGNDTQSAAAGERVVWVRRHREAQPARAPVAGSIGTGAMQRLSITRLPPFERDLNEGVLAAVDRQLGDDAYAVARAAGRAMTLKECVGYALRDHASFKA